MKKTFNKITKIIGLACIALVANKNATAQITITGQQNPCPNGTYTYTCSDGAGSDCSEYGYLWSVPNSAEGWLVGGDPTTNTVVIQWGNCAHVTLNCMETIDCGGDFSYETAPAFTVTGVCYAKPTVSITPSSLVCGASSKVTLSTTQQSTGIYVWTIPAGFTLPSGVTTTGNYVYTTSSSSFTATATASADGTISVFEDITSACTYTTSTASCTFSRIGTLLPAPTFASTNVLTLCSGALPTVSYSINPVSGAASYNWTLTGPAHFATTGSPTSISSTTALTEPIQFTGTGPCTLCVSTNNSCGSGASDCETINTYSTVPGSGTLTGKAAPSPCVGEAWQMTANIPNATSYIWTNGNNTAFTLDNTTTTVAYNGLEINQYSISTIVGVQGKNVCGLSSSIAHSSFYASSQTFCNGQMKKATTIGSENQDGNLIKMYPNPANTELNIEYTVPDGVTNVNMDVYDMLGKKVTTWVLDANSGNAIENVSGLTKGMYIYVVTANDNVLERGKLMIQR